MLVHFKHKFGNYNAKPILAFLYNDLHISSKLLYEPVHEISHNMVCETSKASDQPAHMRSLIRAFASPLNIL